LRLAKFPDNDFLLCRNIPYGEGEKGAREAAEAPPKGGRPSRALNGATRAGRKPRLDKEQLALVEKELLRGATGHGRETELWSLPRVAKRINSVTGVSYHPGHVWKILRQMNWSLQRPTLRAKERDEEKIRQWKTQSWEEQKKLRTLACMGSFP
jgi:transposase